MPSEYTNKEVLEAVYEIRDRVTRIETKIEESLKQTEKVEDMVDEAFDKALEAKDVAEEALALAQRNKEVIHLNKERTEKELEEIRRSSRWAWGFVITLAIAVIGEFLGIKIK